MSKKPLSVLIYGPAKVGKSTFANTAPGPRLVVDFESSAHWLRGNKIQWDPTSEPVPTADGTWDMAYVPVQDYHDVEIITNVLLSGQHPFRSVIVDSLSEGQKLIKDENIGRVDMDLQKWGRLADLTGNFARDLRNMTSRRNNPIEYVVIIATEKILKEPKTQEVLKIKPALQGSTQAELPYLYDVTGYYYLSNDLEISPDGDNTKNKYVKNRYLFTESNDKYATGSRVPVLQTTFKNPTINGMIDIAYQEQ